MAYNYLAIGNFNLNIRIQPPPSIPGQSPSMADYQINFITGFICISFFVLFDSQATGEGHCKIYFSSIAHLERSGDTFFIQYRISSNTERYFKYGLGSGGPGSIEYTTHDRYQGLQKIQAEKDLRTLNTYRKSNC